MTQHVFELVSCHSMVNNLRGHVCGGGPESQAACAAVGRLHDHLVHRGQRRFAPNVGRARGRQQQALLRHKRLRCHADNVPREHLVLVPRRRARHHLHAHIIQGVSRIFEA